jgi:hypothetical protein
MKTYGGVEVLGIKEVEIHTWNRRESHSFGPKPERHTNLEEAGIEKNIILMRIFKALGCKDSEWFRKGLMEGFCEQSNEPLNSTNSEEFLDKN